ncbi:MAG: UDP-N-acetylglucosamine 1-carboxyvinyltransferase [Zetaproteobacteria bacterium]|nr:UDP-N-acetylglucosamine 1-carboxyvinyltransferase [Pseudobdellovibrionaceae bacterium]
MSKFIIEGGHPLNGTIKPSGNKNEALPALFACLLTEEPVTLKNVPRIQDVLTSCEILRQLGAKVEWLDEETLLIEAKNLDYKKPDPELCAHIRASILLLGPLLARFKKVELPLPGGDIIGARRIDSHLDSFIDLGAEIELTNIINAKLRAFCAGEIFLDEPSVTATENILLFSAISSGTTTLHNAACEPHVAGLCRMLNNMGAKITGIGTNQLTIEGVSGLKKASHRISSDFMEIGSFLCLASITQGQIEITDVNIKDLRFVLKTLKKVGIKPEIKEKSLIVSDQQELITEGDATGRVATIYTGPWPAFPTDLLSVSIVAATQSKGTLVFHEKMFESRLFFTDKLMAMGANIVLCDPHRVVVTGPAKLKKTNMSSPDVRAGMALLMAALVASGTSEIHNIYQIDRGYYQIEKKLESLGAKIKRAKA